MAPELSFFIFSRYLWAIMKTRAFFLILTAALLCMQGSAQTLLPRPEAASSTLLTK